MSEFSINQHTGLSETFANYVGPESETYICPHCEDEFVFKTLQPSKSEDLTFIGTNGE